MSSAVDPSEERDLLAAEYALGLLAGEERLTARGLLATDPDFATRVADWERRLAPLYDGFQEVGPPDRLWPQIRDALDAERPGGADVLALRRRQRWWRGYAAAMTAVAASLALVLGYQSLLPDQRRPAALPQPIPQAEATLVAALASEDGRAALAVSYDPGTSSMIVAPATLRAAPGRGHELWLIPAGGPPVSLGVVRAGAPARHRIPAAALGAVGPQATIALSIEPALGSPSGQPTGPVIASAPLTRL